MDRESINIEWWREWGKGPDGNDVRADTMPSVADALYGAFRDSQWYTGGESFEVRIDEFLARAGLRAAGPAAESLMSALWDRYRAERGGRRTYTAPHVRLPGPDPEP